MTSSCMFVELAYIEQHLQQGLVSAAFRSGYLLLRNRRYVLCSHCCWTLQGLICILLHASLLPPRGQLPGVVTIPVMTVFTESHITNGKACLFCNRLQIYIGNLNAKAAWISLIIRQHVCHFCCNYSSALALSLVLQGGSFKTREPRV